MTEGYQYATFCLNGHVISSSTAHAELFCIDCGEKTISNCGNCNAFIRGKYYSPSFIDLRPLNVPNYCYACGTPYPWTKQLLDNAVELISLDDNLSDDIKETIKNALPDLVLETPRSPVAEAKYKKYISGASEYIQTALRNLLIGAVSETVKKSIWG